MLAQHYSPLVIGLSILLGCLGAFTTLHATTTTVAKPWHPRLLLGAAILGSTIWSMHFIGMLALHLPVPVTYTVLPTLISWLFAIAGAALALRTATHPTAGQGVPLRAGVILGVSIVAMHYTGMAAVHESIHVHYSWPFVLLSFLIAVSSATGAFHLVRELHRTGPDATSRPLLVGAASFVLSLTIGTTHYTAMAGVGFRATEVGATTGGILVQSGQISMLVLSTALGLLAILGAFALLNLLGRWRDRQALLIANTLNAELERRVTQRTEELESLAFRDPLTGVRNRRAFDYDLERFARSDTGLVSFQLLLLDIDNLKFVNDTHGHDQGDELIRSVAELLTQTFRSHDSTYRLGGDEFVVLVRGTVNEQALLERLRNALERARSTKNPYVSASIGLAAYPADAYATNDLMRLADQRMLRDKAARKVQRKLSVPARTIRSDAGNDLLLQTVRSTLAIIARDGEVFAEEWRTLLQAAVAAVPDAEAGSLFLREGEEFVLRAQVGHTDALLGLRQPEWVATAWYGDPFEQRTGKVRLLREQQIVERSVRANGSGDLDRNNEALARHGQLHFLRASLCAPIVVHGEVEGQLNLDHLTSTDGFDEDAQELAGAFAAQFAALLAVSRHRQRERPLPG